MITFLIILAVVLAIVAKHIFFWRPLDTDHLYTNGPLLMGHRGSPKTRPENTSPSFNHAVESGLSAVEIDVLATRDDKIICCRLHTIRDGDPVGICNESVLFPKILMLLNFYSQL